VARSSGDRVFGWTEGAVIDLVLKVERPGTRVVYVLTGHGEGGVDDAGSPDGLGLFAAALGDASFEVRPLLLSALPAVPPDAAAVVVGGPVKPLSDHEIEALGAWVRRGGRVLAMLDPATDSGLDDLLAAYRIEVRDDLVVDRTRSPFTSPRPGLVPIIEDFPPHPSTRGFRERIALDRARSIDVRSSGRLPGVEIEAEAVARTGERAWAKTDYAPMLRSGRVRRDAEDRPGPIAVAAAARAPVPVETEAAASPESRWVVIGDSQLARNAGIGAYFNREFLVNTMEWLVGSEERVGLGPRTLRPSRLSMSRADYRNLFRFSVLLVPEVLMILGLSVWWWRRSL
jgi:hypothetical protein